MAHSKTEKSPAFELVWSLERVAQNNAGPALKLSFQFKAQEDLYISDRLWDYAKGGKRIPDPFGVYRFVVEGSLLLVFAQAPSPPNVLPRVVYTPLFSHIPAGETRKNSVLMPLPVDEYSSLERDTDAPTAVEQVSRATLILGYRLRSTMDKDAAPPPRENAEEAGYIVHNPQLIVSALDVDPIAVKRRTEPTARFTLPRAQSASPPSP